MELHPLIIRQLKKSNINVSDLSAIPSEYQSFLALVNESYLDFEEERMLLERSLDISSKEYMEKIDQIHNLQATLVGNEKMAGIGQLSAGIAHEINNPLGFIQSNIETLAKYLDRIATFHEMESELLLPENYNDTEKIACLVSVLNQHSKKSKIDRVYKDLPNIINETLQGAYRISKIVKSLLSFSRRGGMNDFESYDFNKGLKDTITIAYNEIKYYAKIEENYEEVPMVLAKSGEINQVLLNILMNAVYAIKSTERMGVISIYTYLKDVYVCCEITDNGQGISDEYISHIFEPFFTTKPVGTGTGLGLSISHDIIVNKHNGKIDVKSEIGKGTTFTIQLPLHTERMST